MEFGTTPRRTITGVCFLLLVLALALPVDLALQFLGTPVERLVNLALVLALIALLGTPGLVVSGWVTGLVLVPLLVASLFVRLLYYGLVHFSGQGYGPELFLHFEPESLRIAWYEFDDLIYRAVAVALLGAGAFWGMVRSAAPARPRGWPALGGAIAVLFVLVAGRGQLPEWQLWQAWQGWQGPGSFTGAKRTNEPLAAAVVMAPRRLGEDAEQWSRAGLVDTSLIPKSGIRAEAPEQPRNLVLLYVEGLTSAVVEHPEYPGLMPNFQRLTREHGWINEFHTSGFVTIEGIANTQCGLLFPFRGRGSGFAGRQILAHSLPCLGDVLADAGYHQVYLGGSPMSFTGKGAFLAAHGYDNLKGWEYWQSQGQERSPGHWGLGDIELLEQARLEVARGQALDEPFNVTALTVGTHIPGYSYEGCEPYGSGKNRFLDALHCTDQIIAEWIERLEADKLLEGSLLVIVGDHPVFANPDMHGLFGDAIYDTRLPLIVIGDDLKAPLHERGAGFDLAPTLLDLLGIRHNAEFAMGRSLAAPHDRPDYLVTRRHDIHQGTPVHNPPRECERSKARTVGAGTPSVPLSPCEKRELLDLLYQLARAHSHRSAPMDCTAEEPALLRIPGGRIGPVAIRVNGLDWSNRFSWRGRMTHPTEPGLYTLALDQAGRPHAATFLPAETVATADPEPLPKDITTANTVLVAWRPANRETVDLSPLLPALPGNLERAAAWLVDPNQADPLAARFPAGGNAAVLSINRTTCERLRQ